MIHIGVLGLQMKNKLVHDKDKKIKIEIKLCSNNSKFKVNKKLIFFNLTFLF